MFHTLASSSDSAHSTYMYMYYMYMHSIILCNTYMYMYLPQCRALLREGSELHGHPLLSVIFPALLHKEGVGGHPASDAWPLTGGCWDDHIGTLLLYEGLYGVQGGACSDRGRERAIQPS